QSQRYRARRRRSPAAGGKCADGCAHGCQTLQVGGTAVNNSPSALGVSMKRIARHAAFYAGLVAVWVILAKLRIWPPYVFPTPQGVWESLHAGFEDHSFWIAIGVSMRRMLLGYGLSVVLGMVLGLGVASNKFLEETMGGLLVSLQSLPSICWLPLAVLWFGLTEKAILFVVVMG